MAQNQTAVPLRIAQTPAPKLAKPDPGLSSWITKLRQTIDRSYGQLARSISEHHGAGTLSERPPAGVKNRTYLVTDAVPQNIQIDNGSTWFDLVAGAVSVIATINVSSATALAIPSAAFTIVLVATGAVFTVTLPPAASCVNRVFFLKNTGGSNFNLAGNGGELIDGSPTQTVPPGADIQVAPAGSAWVIL